ncbi:photosystem I 8.1 kDa protein, partial [Haematococcus lacustris]
MSTLSSSRMATRSSMSIAAKPIRTARLVCRAEEAAPKAAPKKEVGPKRGSMSGIRYPVVVRFEQQNYAGVSTNNYALDEEDGTPYTEVEGMQAVGSCEEGYCCMTWQVKSSCYLQFVTRAQQP